jgi:hypothetical protein
VAASRPMPGRTWLYVSSVRLICECPQPFRDNLGMDALRQQQRRVGVAEDRGILSRAGPPS